MVNELAVKQLNPGQRPMEAWRGEIRTQLHAIYRECPRDMAIDEQQALDRVAGVMLAGSGVPLARRYLIKGLRADGFAESDIARALRASDDELRRALGALPIWEDGLRRANELRARVLPTGESPVLLSRSMENTERRQGNLKRGSRGFRQPAEWPQPTTTPPHA